LPGVPKQCLHVDVQVLCHLPPRHHLQWSCNQHVFAQSVPMLGAAEGAQQTSWREILRASSSRT